MFNEYLEIDILYVMVILCDLVMLNTVVVVFREKSDGLWTSGYKSPAGIRSEAGM